VFLIARRPHAHTRSSMYRSPVCARAGARARGASGRAPRTPDDHNNDESFLFVPTNENPGPRVRCAAVCPGRPPPEGGRRGWILAGVVFAGPSPVFSGNRIFSTLSIQLWIVLAPILLSAHTCDLPRLMGRLDAAARPRVPSNGEPYFCRASRRGTGVKSSSLCHCR